jgi:SAM-dependent methyltransferase
MDDFLVPHLPNKYIGRIGVEGSEFDSQLDALLRLPTDAPAGPFPTETRLPRSHFSTDYYAKAQPELIDLVPRDARRVLSVGCGWGETERRLADRGAQVAAIPLDPVIAACARRRGVEILDPAADAGAPGSRQFDCLLTSHVVHLLPDPAAALASFRRFLAPGGTAVVAVPNVGRASVRWRRLRRDPGFREIGDHGKSGVHLATAGSVRRWLAGAGFDVTRIVPIVPPRRRWIDRLSAHTAEGLLASDLVAAATRRD